MTKLVLSIILTSILLAQVSVGMEVDETRRLAIQKIVARAQADNVYVETPKPYYQKARQLSPAGPLSAAPAILGGQDMAKKARDGI